jgi:hypothetical protein
MTAVPGACESDIEEPSFFGMGEGLCARQHHAKQWVIFDAGGQPVHGCIASQDEDIVGLQPFRTMQGQKLKV